MLIRIRKVLGSTLCTKVAVFAENAYCFTHFLQGKSGVEPRITQLLAATSFSVQHSLVSL
jgi:hypothetical protein